MKDEDLCIEWYFYKYLATPVDDKVVNPSTGRLTWSIAKKVGSEMRIVR
jgi:hypothetical protein